MLIYLNPELPALLDRLKNSHKKVSFQQQQTKGSKFDSDKFIWLPQNFHRLLG